MTISQYLKWRKMNFGHFLFTFTKNNGNRKWESLIFLHIKKSAWLLRPDTLFYAFFVTIQSPISFRCAASRCGFSPYEMKEKNAHSCKHDSHSSLSFRMALNSYHFYFTSTSSISKFSSFPAISWLASNVILVSSFAVTFTGNGWPYWFCR